MSTAMAIADHPLFSRQVQGPPWFTLQFVLRAVWVSNPAKSVLEANVRSQRALLIREVVRVEGIAPPSACSQNKPSAADLHPDVEICSGTRTRTWN